MSVASRAIRRHGVDCPICLMKMTDVMVTRCGHAYCCDCWNEYVHSYTSVAPHTAEAAVVEVSGPPCCVCRAWFTTAHLPAVAARLTLAKEMQLCALSGCNGIDAYVQKMQEHLCSRRRRADAWLLYGDCLKTIEVLNGAAAPNSTIQAMLAALDAAFLST